MIDTARYVQQLAYDLGVGNNEPILVHTDSQGAIDLVHKEGDSKIATNRIFRIRQFLQDKLIEIKYLPTDRMPAGLRVNEATGQPEPRMLPALG